MRVDQSSGPVGVATSSDRGVATEIWSLLDQGFTPTAVMPSTPPPDHSASPKSLVGSRWNDFEIGEVLGAGGMGTVYRGRQISLDRPVAIKVLPAGLAEHPELRERFLREARAIAPIASPHVVQVFHAGNHNGWFFYAMELVDGEDLARQLRRGWRPTADQARDLVTQAARGLTAAARAGIVHRDIKPANLLLGRDGVLRISDFGLVRRSGEDGLTVSGQLLGTVSYLSPEQAEGRLCDPRSDIYALGIVFYELLAGHVPFKGESAAAVIYQHVHAPAIPPTKGRSRADAANAAICAKMIAKEPAERYQSGAELIEDLERAAAGRSLRYATVARKRTTSLAMPVALMLLVGSTTIWGWQSSFGKKQDDERIASTLPADQGTAQASDEYGRSIELVRAGLRLRLRAIAPGQGYIGSRANEEERRRDELLGTVRFTQPFWIGETEVTQGQWQVVMGGLSAGALPEADLPVTGIEQAEAQAFCARLGVLLPGLVARLPTEYEWEYAARAGLLGPWAGGQSLATQGWYAANSGGRVHPVRQFLPNPWGLYDVHGNCSEWTADAYAARCGGEMVDPVPIKGASRNLVVKGGSYGDAAEDCRLARRLCGRRADRSIGFRVLVTELP